MTPKDKANQATITEAAEILGVPASVLKNAVNRGAIASTSALRPVVVHRYMLVVDLEDVEAWLSVPRRPGRKSQPLESDDPHELARIRGIKYVSACAAIRRARRW